MGFCEVNSCCCGLIQIKDGAIYWPLLDGLLNIMICLCTVITFGELWGLALLLLVCLESTLAYSLYYKKVFFIYLCQIFFFLYIICILATAIILLPIMITKGKTDQTSTTEYLILMCVMIIVAFYYIYFFIVVNSYRMELKRPPCSPVVETFLINIFPKADTA